MNITESPFRVSITGIDGAGKDTVALSSLTHLSEEDGLMVTKTTRPYYQIVNGQVEELYPIITRVSDAAHRFADGTRNRRLIGCLNTLNTLAQSRILEPAALRADPRPDVIASARDLRIDPAVYSGYYFPDRTRNTSVGDLVERISRLTGIKRDMVVWLEVDPVVAIERIEQRIENETKEREKNQGRSTAMREKWRHLHENPDSLAELASRYGEAICAVVNLYPDTQIVKIDTTDMTQSAVVEKVYTHMQQAIADKINPHGAPQLSTKTT